MSIDATVLTGSEVIVVGVPGSGVRLDDVVCGYVGVSVGLLYTGCVHTVTVAQPREHVWLVERQPMLDLDKYYSNSPKATVIRILVFADTVKFPSLRSITISHLRCLN